MKVSVITLHTVNNYGSVMQTYATQKVFEKLGCDVEFVDYWRKSNTPDECAKRLLDSSTMKRLKPIWGLNPFTIKLTVKLLKIFVTNKESQMRKFIRERVTLSPTSYYSIDDLKDNPPEADIYVTGSDQVWNSIWNQGLDRAYFLDYAPVGKPKVSFSASIGRSELERDEMVEMYELLKQYDAISVREASAVQILRDMGLEAKLILDPTLMLNREEWIEIEKEPRGRKTPYLLIYQLHINPNIDLYADTLARAKGWEIVRIGLSRSDKKKIGTTCMNTSVPEFLGLFSHAACVLTDSFHATAFSLNMGTDFISVLPNSFGTRIESITELTGTKDRILSSYDDLSIADCEINKEQVKNILRQEREKGYAFLRNSIYRN